MRRTSRLWSVLMLASAGLEALPVWMDLLTAWRSQETVTPLPANAHDEVISCGEAPNSFWRHIVVAVSTA
jgi:hypothetical protein